MPDYCISYTMQGMPCLRPARSLIRLSTRQSPSAIRFATTTPVCGSGRHVSGATLASSSTESSADSRARSISRAGEAWRSLLFKFWSCRTSLAAFGTRPLVGQFLTDRQASGCPSLQSHAGAAGRRSCCFASGGEGPRCSRGCSCTGGGTGKNRQNACHVLGAAPAGAEIHCKYRRATRVAVFQVLRVHIAKLFQLWMGWCGRL